VLPTTPHVEKGFTVGDAVRGIVVEMGKGIHVALPDDQADEGYRRKIGGASQRTSRRTQMIAQRHNGMLSNDHARQAGIAGD
jgi:hypothetical protein